jgi:hypothetical protein
MLKAQYHFDDCHFDEFMLSVFVQRAIILNVVVPFKKPILADCKNAKYPVIFFTFR